MTGYISKDDASKHIDYQNMIDRVKGMDKLVDVKIESSGNISILLPALYNERLSLLRLDECDYRNIVDKYLADGSYRIKDFMGEIKLEVFTHKILEYVKEEKLLNVEKINYKNEELWVIHERFTPYSLAYIPQTTPVYTPDGNYIGEDIELLLSKGSPIDESIIAKSDYLNKIKLSPIKFNMMMYGETYRRRLVYDENGEKVITGYTKSGNPKYKKKRQKVVLTPGVDQGIFPSVNAIYARVGILNKIAREKREEWVRDAEVWANENNWTIVPEGTQVYADYEFYLPKDNRSRDTHNLLKMHLDSMEGIIYENDKDVLVRIQSVEKVTSSDIEPYFTVNIKYV